MGKMEMDSAKRSRKKKLQHAILMSVAVAGFLPMAVMAPNALQSLAKLGIIDLGLRKKELINRARDRLLKRKSLYRDEEGFLRLSPAGEKELQMMQLCSRKKPRRWDKKWRVLIFDIPEYRGGIRAKLRRSLVGFGFIQLQKSVWVFPYDCEDFVALLKSELHVGKNILYMIVDEIENSVLLKERFSLETPNI